ncbi:MAG: hypothetical protein V1799_08650 [bacterium]
MKKKTISCSGTLKHICDQLGEHRDSATCREIQNHLAGCPECSAYLDSLKKTIHLYKEYPTPKVSSRSRAKLFALLSDSIQSK